MADLSRQHQTIIAGIKGNADGVPGNCWQACIASLLQIPLDSVPHFVHIYSEKEYDEEGNARWYYETRKFVEEQRPGWTLKAYEPTFPVYHGEPSDEQIPPRVILSGQSPRGNWLHSVLVDSFTGELYHDPVPNGSGVLSRVDVMALVPKE